jgi:hypothetical protein
VLALVGTAVGAGCNDRAPARRTDASSPTDTASPTATPTRTPADFEVAYEHPTSVEIGTTVPVTLVITNTGGRAAPFGAPLSVQRPNGTWRTATTREFGVIEPGETVRAESRPYELEYLGRYAFRLGASAPPTTIRTRPATLAWDRAYRTPAGYRLRVGAPELQRAYAYVDPDGIDRARSAPGEQWAFVPLTASNPSEAVVTPPAADDVTLYPSETPYDRTALVERPLYQGQPYVAAELRPNGEIEGYVPYAIPAATSIDDLRVVWAASIDGGDIAVSWQSRGVPPYRGG